MSTALAFTPTDHGSSSGNINISTKGSIALSIDVKPSTNTGSFYMFAHSDLSGFTLSQADGGINQFIFGNLFSGVYSTPPAGTWWNLAMCLNTADGVDPVSQLWINGAPLGGTGTFNSGTKAFADAILSIACYPGPLLTFPGSLARLGIWGVADASTQILTTPNAVALAAGVLPTTIQAGSLLHYWALDGSTAPNGTEVDLVGGVDLLFTGTAQDPSGPPLGGGSFKPLGLEALGFSPFSPMSGVH